MLLQVSSTDEVVTVRAVEDTVNRITAFFIALNYLGILSFARVNTSNNSIVGGAQDYLTTLEEKRRETPGLQFVVVADEAIRKKVYDIMTGEEGPISRLRCGLAVRLGTAPEHLE